MEQFTKRGEIKMIEKYSKTAPIQFSETNFELRLKLYSLINRMQETSSLHAEAIGMGYEVLEAHNLGWIISRYKINMTRYPSWEENITMETWPSGIDRLFAMRRFRIYDADKKQIGSIHCAYILIDTNTSRIQRISALPVPLPIIEDDDKAEEMQKLQMRDKLVSTSKREVHYTDIDLNMHMNNACYVQWIEDCFPLKKYREMQIRDLQVNFISGAKLGEQVEISVYQDEGKGEETYYLQGIEEDGGREVFQAKVVWW